MSLDDRSKREIIERCRLVESQNGLLTQRLELAAKELDSLRYIVVQMMCDFDYLERTYKESLWTTGAGYTLQPRVLELREYLKRTDPDSPTGTADCGCGLGEECPMLPHERPALTGDPRPIQVGDTVRHKTEGWTGTVETSDGYIVGVNCKRGLYGVSQLKRVEPEKGPNL